MNREMLQTTQNPTQNAKAGRKKRDSNLELLRIITMLLIVAHHYVVNSGLMAADGVIYSSPLSWRSLFLLLMGAWGKTGINCFMMITGYFMCKSNITVHKYAKLLCEIMFYRIVINLVFLITGQQAFSLLGLIKIVIPVSQIKDGFTSCFLVFFLFIPFLNILIHKLNQKQHICLLLLCGFMYIAFGTLHRVTINYVSWFMVIYLIASYIRLYPMKLFSNTRLWGLLTAGCIVIASASVICCAALGMKLNKTMAYYFVSDSNTFLAVATGVCSFLFFKNLRIRYNPFINTVAASTFGVLLIHANSDTMRQWLWGDLLDNVGHYGSPFMPLHAIGCCLLIFAACTAIDVVRIRLVETPFFRLVDRHIDKAEQTVRDKLNALTSKFLTSPQEN